MGAVFPLFAFLLGSIIGSFLNVVSLRYNSGLTLGGKSFCFSCRKKLTWFELVPVLSFLFLRGRCASCESKISKQYVLVELFTGLLFLALYFHIFPISLTGALLFFFYATVLSILVVIFVYDLRHKIIPDGLSFLLAGLAFLKLVGDSILQGFVWSPFFAGPLLAAPFFFLWLVSRGRWVGLGDAKLLLGLGWLLGLNLGYTAFLLSVWGGALFSAFLLGYQRLFLRGKGLTMKSEIPFGPFLILGFLFVYFFNFDLFNFLLTL